MNRKETYYKMDYFEYLPHDKLVEFCENLDTVELSRLMIASKRVKNECQFVIDERKLINFKETADEMIKSIYGYVSMFERKQRLIQLLDYLENNYPLIRKVYKSLTISSIIKFWLYGLYRNNMAELEKYRPMIEKLNNYFNLNYDLTGYYVKGRQWA